MLNLNNRILELQNAKENLNNKILDLENKIVQLNNKINTLNNDNINYQNSIKKLTKDNNNLESKLKKINEINNNLNKSLGPEKDELLMSLMEKDKEIRKLKILKEALPFELKEGEKLLIFLNCFKK